MYELKNKENFCWVGEHILRLIKWPVIPRLIPKLFLETNVNLTGYIFTTTDVIYYK